MSEGWTWTEWKWNFLSADFVHEENFHADSVIMKQALIEFKLEKEKQNSTTHFIIQIWKATILYDCV